MVKFYKKKNMNVFEKIYWDLNLFKVKDFFYNLRYFFKNIWNFRKILWSHRNWDYYYCEELYKFSLGLLRDGIKNGIEEERMATKKINAINKLIALLEPIDDNLTGITSNKDYNEIYEEQLSTKYDAIHRILVGQPIEEINKKIEEYNIKHKGEVLDNYDISVEISDGTGCESWWC